MNSGITVLAHNAREWDRMAADAYKTGRNFYGHRYSAASATLQGKTIDCCLYETLQRVYRLWLNTGWKDIDMGVQS